MIRREEERKKEMEEQQKRKLQTFRSQLVNDLGEVEPVLDVLLEKHVLSPQSDEYQIVMAGRFARERARLLLDTLPTLGPLAFEAFVEGLRRAKPHLADLLEKVSGEAVCEGLFPPPIPSVEVACRVQSKLRKSFIQLGRTAKVVDHRRRGATVGLDQLFVTISSLSFDEAQAKFQERKKRSRAPGRSANEASTKELASKTFASRCQDEFELDGVGRLFRRRNGGELVDSCLVVGPAGTGKTVLLQRVVVSWAEGEAEELSGFEIVVLVSARRDAEALKCDTPVEMLGCILQRQYKLSNAERKEMEMYMEMNSGRVLVLLDSADEGGETWAKSEALEMLFERRGLEDCTYVATSRPCSLAYDLVPSCRQRLYLIGFNDRRLDELLIRRLGEEDGVGVAEKLKEPTLQHVRHLMKGTPLVANMVAELAVDGGNVLPSCSTQIYKAMAANMVQRQQRKVSGRPERSAGKNMFACLPDGVKARLEKLGHLALTGLCKRQFVFDMEEVVARCGGEVMDYGFLEEFERESVSQGPCHDVEFRHLTWLEFFAAYALSRMESPLRAIASCAEAVGVEEQTETFWKFVSGLVHLKHLLEVLERLQAAFTGQHNEGLEKRQWVRLACSCIAEAAQQLSSDESVDEERALLEKACAAVIPSKVDVKSSRLSVVDAQLMAITLRHSPHVKNLNVSFCGLKADHCKALGSGLTHIQVLEIMGNPGLHDDHGLDVLSKVIADCGAPQLTHLDAHFSGLNIDDCAAIRLLLNIVTSLRRLLISYNNLGTAGLSKLQDSLGKVKLYLLDVGDSDMDNRAGRVLADIVEANQHLLCLYVMNNSLGNGGVSDLLRGVGRSRSLQVMDFSNTSVDDGVMDVVSTCLSQRAHRVKTTGSSSPPPLTLRFHKNKISRTALEELAHNVPDGSKDRVECGPIVVEGGEVADRDYGKFFEKYTLRGSGSDLKMYNQGIDSNGAEQIASLLKENSDVQALDLADNAIGDTGVAALCGALCVNTTLRGVDMTRNRVGAAELVSMAKTLATPATCLQFINLRENPVFTTTSGVASEGQREALHQLVAMSGLRGLGLSFTGLGDAECQVIGDALASDRCCLSVLLIGGNEISDKGAAALCSGLEKNTSLKFVNLANNHIGSAGAERIGRCLEYHEKQGSPLRQVWMEGNPANPEVYTGCMVNGQIDFWSVTDFMKTYL